MARLALPTAKHKRASLRRAGIPDAHDVLAIFLRWRKQQQLSAAQIKLAKGARMKPAASERSVFGSDEVREPLSPLMETASRDFDRMGVEKDLFGIGGQFA